jgi:hypothetical protein
MNARPPSRLAGWRQPWLLGLALAALWGAASFFSCHNDLSYIAWISHFVPDTWDVYGAVGRVHEEHLAHIPYPPLAYWLIGIWMAAGRALFGLFQHPGWDLYMQSHGWQQALPLSAGECFFLRLLYLPFCLGTAYFLARLSPSGKPVPRLGALMLAQPILIFITFFMGQFDVIPVFFCVLAVFAFGRGPAPFPVVLGFLSLAAGTLMKNFPAALVPVYLALFLFKKTWRRGAVYGFLAYASAILLALHLVWGPALIKSCLQFREMNLDFLLGRTSTAGKFTDYLLILVLTGGLLAWRRGDARSLVRRVSDALADPARFRLTLLLLPLPVLGLILFGRLWHPQYIVWILPWVVLFGVLAPWLFPAGHPAGTMARRLPAFLTVAFFPAVFARFPKWVDSDLLLNKPPGATLGQFLRPYEVLFTFIASCVLLWILITSLMALRRLLWEENLPSGAFDPEPPPERAAWFHLAGFLLLIVLAWLVQALVAPPF